MILSITKTILCVVTYLISCEQRQYPLTFRRGYSLDYRGQTFSSFISLKRTLYEYYFWSLELLNNALSLVLLNSQKRSSFKFISSSSERLICYKLDAWREHILWMSKSFENVDTRFQWVGSSSAPPLSLSSLGLFFPLDTCLKIGLRFCSSPSLAFSFFVENILSWS